LIGSDIIHSLDILCFYGKFVNLFLKEF